MPAVHQNVPNIPNIRQFIDSGWYLDDKGAIQYDYIFDGYANLVYTPDSKMPYQIQLFTSEPDNCLIAHNNFPNAKQAIAYAREIGTELANMPENVSLDDWTTPDATIQA